MHTLFSICPEVVVLDMRLAMLESVTRVLQKVRTLLPHARIVAIGDPDAEAHARVAVVAGAYAYEGTGVTAARVRRAILFATAGLVHLNSTGKRAALSIRSKANTVSED
jgi:DNA-binding NarL/FixJ family response regulator